MHSYSAFGLRIGSQITLPALPAAFYNRFEAVIYFANIEVPPNEAAIVSGDSFCITRSGVYRFWDDLGTLLIRNGSEILVDPAPEVDVSVIRAGILGAGFGTLLHQRGHLILHASSVVVDGKAVVFAGGSGQGKSTIALALYRRGYKLLSDDVTAIDMTAAIPRAILGYSQINVQPDVLVAHSCDPTQFDKVEPALEKRVIPTRQAYSDSVFLLKQIYVLAEGDETEIEVLGSFEALAELLGRSYCFRMLTPRGRSKHLAQCAKLAQTASVLRFKICRSLEELPAAIQLLEAHF